MPALAHLTSPNWQGTPRPHDAGQLEVCPGAAPSIKLMPPGPAGLDSSSLTLLDTTTWAAAKQWAFPCRLASIGFGLRSGTERVLTGGLPSDTPSSALVQPPAAGLGVLPALRVSLFAAPETGMPLLLQVRGSHGLRLDIHSWARW